MTNKPGKVYIVDDDNTMRDALAMLFQAENMEVSLFANAQEFLEVDIPDQPSCLITDLRMPGMSGLGLQRELLERGITLPVIFITGHGDIDKAVEAMKQGAIDFIEKPFRNDELLQRTHACLNTAEQMHQEKSAIAEAGQRLANLTQREYDVLKYLVQGLSSKEIARELEISPKTVDIHRGHILEKCGATSVTNLMHILTPVLSDLTPG